MQIAGPKYGPRVYEAWNVASTDGKPVIGLVVERLIPAGGFGSEQAAFVLEPA